MYVGIHHQFKHDNRASKIISFEAKGTQKLKGRSVISLLWQKIRLAGKTRAKNGLALEAIRSKEYLLAGEFLYPIDLEHDGNLVSFPQRRKTPL